MLAKCFLQGVEASLGGCVAFAAATVFASTETHGAAHLANSEETSRDDAGGDEGSGFGAVNGFDELGCGGFALGFDVDYLAADHSWRKGGFEIADAAYSSAD